MWGSYYLYLPDEERAFREIKEKKQNTFSGSLLSKDMNNGMWSNATHTLSSCHFCLSRKKVYIYFLYMLLSWTHQYQRLIGTPLQYSSLENPMDGGAWWAAVHGVAISRTRLSDFTFTSHFHALEKEMATHSGVLAWRIPGTGEPGGLLSMGSHRVGHDWSDLAAAAEHSEAIWASKNCKYVLKK